MILGPGFPAVYSTIAGLGSDRHSKGQDAQKKPGSPAKTAMHGTPSNGLMVCPRSLLLAAIVAPNERGVFSVVELGDG